MQIKTLQAQARQQLAEQLGLTPVEARIEAQALLCAALGRVSPAWLMAHEEEVPDSPQRQCFVQQLQRRLLGEPIAYILGEREFYGLTFRLTPAVLIPRPDTETLVNAALQCLSEPPLCVRPAATDTGLKRAQVAGVRVLDLGTGSGAVAIAIAAHQPEVLVTAVDNSLAALQVASDNAQTLLGGLPASRPQSAIAPPTRIANVRLLLSDWFSALEGEIFNLIVSNPPYIAVADPHLRQGDLRYEPSAALAAGEDGLDPIRRIVADAPSHLAAGGWLLLEHGHDQADRVASLMQGAGLAEISHLADLAGIRRVTLGQKIDRPFA